MTAVQGRTSARASAVSAAEGNFWIHCSAAGSHDDSERRVQCSVSESERISSSRPQV